MSFQAPTKTYFIKKGQGFADCNFDASLERNSAGLGTNHSISWNFKLADIEVFDEGVDAKDIQFSHPKVLRVYELHVDIQDLWKMARDADIPMNGIIDVGMFDVSWLKSYTSH